VSQLSAKLQLACGEHSFDELRLQCGLFWARWRRVHSVPGRKVQDVNRIVRVHELSVKHQLACGELNVDELHLNNFDKLHLGMSIYSVLTLDKVAHGRHGPESRATSSQAKPNVGGFGFKPNGGGLAWLCILFERKNHLNSEKSHTTAPECHCDAAHVSFNRLQNGFP